MINEILGRVESAIYGEKSHNLEIDLKRVPMMPQSRNLKAFQGYLGTFIVTERGYLLKGYDDRLWKKNAIIYDNETIPPQIHYENGGADQVIHDILGLRLLGIKHSYETKKERLVARVCLV